MKEISSYTLACTIARVLDEKSGKDITILNISNVSSFADYFVICSADASTQVKALTESVKLRLKELFSRQPGRIENDRRNRWNLLDYSDVVVHILHREEREAYAIEKFWNHAFSISSDEWMKESEDYSEYK
ncbi:MAG: ribosome silencing factor [Candidatus Gastranaerophilales bacterium]|nr:ribosome silencing factor [Candidatus Gastranaerophilales bacterium]